MSHLTLQLGTALVVPFLPHQREHHRIADWRVRAWREAALTQGDFAAEDVSDAMLSLRCTSRMPWFRAPRPPQFAGAGR